MSTMNIFDMSDTWNDGATTFAGIKLNVTDTASASVSMLIDLHVGGSSKFSVRKDGSLYSTKTILAMGVGGGGPLLMGTTSGAIGYNMASTLGIGWTSGSSAVSAPDLSLYRDAAGTLAQRNGTNAQAFRVYNTFTDASNYERGVFNFTSVANQLTIGTEKAGTGATSIVRFVVGGTRVAISDGSYFQIEQDLYALGNVIMAAKYTQMTEMTAPAAPAANKVRIYAEDDGAGKTRLMALFASGVAQQIAIEP